MNQAQGFDHLMQVLAIDQAKSMVPERLVEIEDFELHVKALMSGYLKSLELAKNTEARVLEQFGSRLESKDKLIEDLQKQIEVKDSLMAASQSAYIEAENAQHRAEKSEKEAVEKLAASREAVRDKESINSMLAAKLAEAESKLAFYPDLKEKFTVLEKGLAEAEIERERTVRNAEDNIRREKDQEIMQLQIELVKVRTSAEERAAQSERKEADRLFEITRLQEQLEKVREERDFLKAELAMLRSSN